MARCTHVIVDYDDESDLCNDSTGESDTFAWSSAAVAVAPKSRWSRLVPGLAYFRFRN
jgi:hypothetical protein